MNIESEVSSPNNVLNTQPLGAVGVGEAFEKNTGRAARPTTPAQTVAIFQDFMFMFFIWLYGKRHTR
jgi:hypothetical protein